MAALVFAIVSVLPALITVLCQLVSAVLVSAYHNASTVMLLATILSAAPPPGEKDRSLLSKNAVSPVPGGTRPTQLLASDQLVFTCASASLPDHVMVPAVATDVVAMRRDRTAILWTSAFIGVQGM